MYGILAASMADWPIIHQIAWLFGKIMNVIYNVMDSAFGIQNIGICIIIFTIITYTLMIPLTIKQQKFTKMSAVMQPEIQKIQKKYANKKDQASQLKMNEEVQAVYEKYGTSMTGGCLPLLIQMPILFSLYPVIQNIPDYVTRVKDAYMPLVNQIMATDGFQKIMETIGSGKPVLMSASAYDYSKADTLVSVLYRFQDATWGTLVDKLPSLEGIVNSTMQTVNHMNNFLGINIGETPLSMLSVVMKNFTIVGFISAIIIPVFAGLTQFVSMKMQPQATDTGDNQMAASMKSMNYTMPMISVIMGFTLPAGLGLYWGASAVVRTIQMVIVNKYLGKKTVEELIEENRKKAAKKREKKGTSAQTINRMATTSTKNVEAKKKGMSEAEKDAVSKRAEAFNRNAKPGSLASKANMVSRYNSGQSSVVEKPAEESTEEKKEEKTSKFGFKKEKKK